MNWIEEDGAREIGSPEWNAWSQWNDEIFAAMMAAGITESPHFMLDEPTRSLPQECEICRHNTEIKEQIVGETWEKMEP